MMTHRFHDHSIVSRQSLLLLPLNGCYLQGRVASLPCEQARIAESTTFHFSTSPSREVTHRYYYSKHVQQVMRAVRYSLGEDRTGNDIVRCRGLLVAGSAGSGKTAFLQNLLSSVQRTEAIRKTALLVSVSSFAFADPFAMIEENP